MRRFLWIAVALSCAVAPLPAARAAAGDDRVCAAALAQAPLRRVLPRGLLGALAVVESGRLVGDRVVPWPWTINVGGTGRYFETKEAAIAAVRELQAQGEQSIDVGCLQINLMFHPNAFASLDEAFDAEANAAYAARFVFALYQGSGSWERAVTAYHSNRPDLRADYARRVVAVWPAAASYGLVDAGIGTADRIDPYHVYTAAFARRVAADLADRARRNARPTAAPARSALRFAAAAERHGPAWPRGVP